MSQQFQCCDFFVKWEGNCGTESYIAADLYYMLNQTDSKIYRIDGKVIQLGGVNMTD